MADFELRFSDKLDLNVALDGGGDDQGVTYEMPVSFLEYAEVSASGVVTPKKPGVILVYAKDASGHVAREFIIQIMSDAEAKLNQEVESGLRQIVASGEIVQGASGWGSGGWGSVGWGA